MRGDEHRRPELVAVREIGEREGDAWPGDDAVSDERMLSAALDAVEKWLGETPYVCGPRRKTARAVPGTILA